MDKIHTGKCRYKIQEKKKFQYGIPAYTGPFKTLDCNNLIFFLNIDVFEAAIVL
jgi:hypothetical protein